MTLNCTISNGLFNPTNRDRIVDETKATQNENEVNERGFEQGKGDEQPREVGHDGNEKKKKSVKRWRRRKLRASIRFVLFVQQKYM